MLITADGIVIRSYPVGDHDSVVHILTENHGRLPVMVKGSRSKRNCGESASCTQLFTYGNYELYRGKGEFYYLRNGSVLHSFYELSGDLARMALATYLCDVAAELTDEGGGDEAAELMRMLLNSLYVLGRRSKPCTLVKGVFELRAASLSGYMPNLTGCTHCGNGYPENAYLDVMNGRMLCADCQSKLNRLAGRIVDAKAEELGERRIICPMSSSVLAAVRYALTAPEKKIFSFSLADKEEEMSFERVAESYLLNQLERGFDTLQFYRSVL